jgi:hypothetical protein
MVVLVVLTLLLVIAALAPRYGADSRGLADRANSRGLNDLADRSERADRARQ